MRIAIGHDLVERATDGNPQSFSAGWKGLADELGVEAEVIEPLLPGAIGRIGGFDGFIWRYNFRQPWTDAGPQIMAVVEDQHGLPVWLTWGTQAAIRATTDASVEPVTS